MNKVQNFLIYRKQCFENFLSLYTLFKNQSNYKKFIKTHYRKRINFYLNYYKNLAYKRKIYLRLFSKQIFLYSILINIFLDQFLINRLITKLRYTFLAYVDYKSNVLLVSHNNFQEFLKILQFIDLLQKKSNSQVKFLEITNLTIKSPKVLYTYHLFIYYKFGVNLDFLNKLRNLIYLNHRNLILVQTYYLISIYYLLFLLFQIYNDLFILIFYGYFTSIRKRL